ncbi:plastocyanin, partial [Arthrobacter sp. 2762]
MLNNFDARMHSANGSFGLRFPAFTLLVSVCLSIALTLTWGVRDSVADMSADVTSPELVSVSLASPKQVGPGDKIRFNWTVRDRGPITGVSFWVYGPGQKYKPAYMVSSYSSGPGLYSGTSETAVIDSLSWPAGDYVVTLIMPADSAGNSARVEGSSALLPPLTSTVSGTSADVTSPELVSVSLASPKQVGPGDKIRFNWTVRDRGPITGVSFWVYGPGQKYKP